MRRKREHDLELKARRFIDKVLEINREDGSDVKLSEDEYRQAIDEVARPFEKLHSETQRPAETS